MTSMAFLGLGKQKRTSVTIIDIDSSSVGIALMYFNPTSAPTICYQNRTLTEFRADEDLMQGTLRTLNLKMRELIEKAAPILRHDTGSGHSDHIYLRINTPWQKTLIRRERVEAQKPFTFTAALQRDILKKKGEIPAGFKNLDESVIATLLNGYETQQPLGKQARQAEVVVASSWIDETVAPELQKIVRSTYHTHALTILTPALVTETVFKTLFPHEKNYLTLEITGESTEMLYVKNGILVKVASLELGVNDIIRQARQGTPRGQARAALTDSSENAQYAEVVEQAEASWLQKMEALFQEFAAEQALPRTIFLVAPEGTREYLTRLLDTASLRSLWLSDEPLRIIAIAQAQLSSFVTLGAIAEPDTVLGLFALFARNAIHTPLPKA